MMRRSTIENVFGAAQEPEIETLRPRPRRVRVPQWPLVPLLALAGVGVARAYGVLTEAPVVDWVLLVLAGPGVGVLAARLEERAFLSIRSEHRFARFLIALVTMALGVALTMTVIAHYTDIPEAAGRVAILAAFFGLWLATAAFGSFVMLVIDVGLLRHIVGLRRRVIFAVLALIALAFSFSAYICITAFDMSAALRAGKMEPELRGYLAAVPLARSFVVHPHKFVLGALVAAGLAILPAILSVCSKLAETVTERITPLVQAFDRIAHGNRSVHLEEAGGPEFVSLALSFNQMIDKLRIAERIERAFGQYVSTQVLDRVRAQRGAGRLPAEVRTATVFFADVRGFTPMSERLPPEHVVEILNRWLEEAVPLVESYEGFLNKFVGDAVVVVFNGPIEQPDHAERATLCAIALQQLCTKLNDQRVFAEAGELKIGIGIATGPMLCGSIGAKSRVEYTVIGDTVNLASRMTGHAQGGEVWISEATAALLGPDRPVVAHEPLRFKGKERAVVPYRAWPI